MRKFLSLLFLCVVFGASAQSYDQRAIGYDELPTEARKFLERHFAPEFDGAQPTDITSNGERHCALYGQSVRVEFNFFGNWTLVESYLPGGVPLKIIPKRITKYLDTNIMGGHYIVNMERSIEGIDVDLENGMELSFTVKGHLK